MTRKRVLLVGGSGVFGERLARGLLETMDIDLIVAGRSADRAAATTKALGAATSTTLDRTTATAADIAALKPDLVIDAAGPFQGADLSFARAAIAAGADYLDLADARDFVGAFPKLDAEAKAANVRAFTGASSTPALSHAALDALTAGWKRIDIIRVGISPANRTPRGRSVIEAILSWAGGPMRVFTSGGWTERPGWSGGFSHPLGRLGKRRFVLADTPDIDLLPARYHPQEEAILTAGLELDLLHFGMGAVSLLRRWGLMRSLRPLAGLLHWASDRFVPFGTDAGGMFAEAWGRDAEDRPIRAEWTLVIGDLKGPYIPTLPALAMARRLLNGDLIPAGARPCVGVLSLDDMAADLARINAETSTVTEHLVGPFEQALGDAFETLPAAVKACHRAGPASRWYGTAAVKGANGLAAFPAFLFGFPGNFAAALASVAKRTTANGAETWTRDIGPGHFRSHIAYAGPNRVTERFGPFTFTLALIADASGLTMAIESWRVGALPLPRFLAPRSVAVESVSQSGAFTFDVPISAPLLGRLVHYKGELRLTASAPEQKSCA